MSTETILLTGASGFLGFRILEQLVDQAWIVRLAVRSKPKYTALKSALERLGKDTSTIQHVIVPDMTTPAAFKDAVKGVSYVLHVASPLPTPSDDLETSIIKPAVGMTTNMLNAILEDPGRTVKKLVITSSVAAVIPAEPKVFDADEVVLDPEGPYENDFAAYRASKQLAYNTTRRFIAEEKPYFDVINIMPSFIIGRNNFIQSRKEYLAGSNGIALSALLGGVDESGKPGIVCHVEDVAAVHVAALRHSIVGNRNFGVNFDGKDGGIELNSAIDIVKAKLPEAVGPNDLPLGGSTLSQKVPFDASKTERELGIEFKDWETMVLELAKAYVEAKA